jgi:flagellar biosynthesis/type III secretory pathway protein FliH
MGHLGRPLEEGREEGREEEKQIGIEQGKLAGKTQMLLNVRRSQSVLVPRTQLDSTAQASAMSMLVISRLKCSTRLG